MNLMEECGTTTRSEIALTIFDVRDERSREGVPGCGYLAGVRIGNGDGRCLDVSAKESGGFKVVGETDEKVYWRSLKLCPETSGWLSIQVEAARVEEPEVCPEYTLTAQALGWTKGCLEPRGPLHRPENNGVRIHHADGVAMGVIVGCGGEFRVFGERRGDVDGEWAVLMYGERSVVLDWQQEAL